jgi:hypothetical protein
LYDDAIMSNERKKKVKEMRLNEIKNEDDEDLKFRPTISEKS